ncbi:C4-dicarboxylate ABC transporter [Romboutsia weinsteinii]|uniref:C4-dicarboxylate ABC transporter n=1 Tax=Romboutsia weinsteinii TaxID=2020949 RepID=A0A371J5Y5_9FIRM|nr:C4-dicarboxylate transporter DcuC [Romboutsia weinsteinii]RDY28087.1 C4-dicarboxylate ABC transporter [Romboutsia weinsteinii]
MLGLILAAIVSIGTGYFIVKKYKAQTVLLLAGMILMGCAIILGTGVIVSPEETTGFAWFDILEFIKITFSSRAAGMGLAIMAVGGFARYMDKIGASDALVNIAIKPLKLIRSPYLVLAMGYIIGQILNIFIPSASGLGVLLMVTMYPILIKLGVSKLSATAMIGTSACLDLGPASGNAVLASQTAQMSSSIYFTTYQIPVAIVTIIVIAIAHFFVQRNYDKKEGHVAEFKIGNENDRTKLDVPKIYALLPIVPLILILLFSELVFSSVQLDVVTAMFFSTFIALIFELIRKRDVKSVFASIQIFFDGMGAQFAAVVTLIVAGEVFAHGLKSIGAIDTIIASAQSLGFGSVMMTIVMVLIIAVSAIIMGSGNAPFFAFAALVPDIATKLSIPAVSMLLPMQLTAGIARSISPITAVIVAVSGISEVSPFDVIKRTAVPMVIGLLVVVVSNFILFL